MTDPSSNTPLHIDRALLDLGSNTAKLTHAYSTLSGEVEMSHSLRITKMAAKVESLGIIDSEAMSRTLDAVEVLLSESGVKSDVDCIGTWALRKAGNPGELAKALMDRFGLRLRILLEHEEANASFFTVRDEDSSDGLLATLDFGGGSTEISLGSGELPETFASYSIGSRSLTSHVPISDPPSYEEIEVIRREARLRIEGIEPLPTGTTVKLTGITAMAFSALATSLMDKPETEPATTLTPETFDLIVQKLGNMTLDQRAAILSPTHAGWADIILHSAIALREIVGGLGCDTIYLSFRELGCGLIASSIRGVPVDSEAPSTVLPDADFPPLNRPGRRGEVLFALIASDGSIWMQQKSAYPQGVHRLPGGGLEPGEEPIIAAVREIAEEAGIENSQPTLIGRLHYRLPNGDDIPFFSDFYILNVGSAPPVTLDPHEQVSDWWACPREELDRIEQQLVNLPDDRRAWGVFRAAAIRYLRTLIKRYW